MARNGLSCADVPLRNYSLTHSLIQSAPRAAFSHNIHEGNILNAESLHAYK